MRFKLKSARARPGDVMDWLGCELQINDPQNYLMLAKDLLLRRIYYFESTRPNPRIVDCGSNIGASILYFKWLYPGAQVIGFEPDPVVFKYLEQNVVKSKLGGLQLNNVALAAEQGDATFFSDGLYGSQMVQTVQEADELTKEGWTELRVPAVRLRATLEEEVDFLKMNIEGAEFEVLDDCRDLLRNVRQLVVEYHHLPGREGHLHQILGLLHDSGFHFLINDLDRQSNPAVEPPFRLEHNTRYFLLVYAKRLG